MFYLSLLFLIPFFVNFVIFQYIVSFKSSCLKKILTLLFVYRLQRIKNANNFYIHVNTYFYIELKYFSSAIDTWKLIFHDRLTTCTNYEMWPVMERAVSLLRHLQFLCTSR